MTFYLYLYNVASVLFLFYTPAMLYMRAHKPLYISRLYLHLEMT